MRRGTVRSRQTSVESDFNDENRAVSEVSSSVVSLVCLVVVLSYFVIVLNYFVIVLMHLEGESEASANAQAHAHWRVARCEGGREGRRGG